MLFLIDPYEHRHAGDSRMQHCPGDHPVAEMHPNVVSMKRRETKSDGWRVVANKSQLAHGQNPEGGLI